MKSKFLYSCFTLSCVLIVFSACHSKSGKSANSADGDSLKLVEASKFSVKNHSGYTELDVYNPWQGATGVKYRYALVSDSLAKFDKSAYETVVKVPVKRVICLSTTHIGFIDYLNQTSSIVAVSGTNLVNNKELQAKIAQGNLRDVGYESSLNYELIMSLKPDVVFAYGVGHDLGYIAKLKELGIPIVFLAEYLEKTPLARAEWLKFVAAFYQQIPESEKQFDEIAQRYHALQEKVKNVNVKPKVLSGLPWNETWYVAGGKSAAARALTDAGCDYLFSDIDSPEGVPMSIEAVFQKAQQADIWVNTGAAKNKQDILMVDNRMGTLPAFIKGNIYNNNARITPMGGNDSFESGIVRPDVILADLIKIFHPEILPDHQLEYFRKME